MKSLPGWCIHVFMHSFNSIHVTNDFGVDNTAASNTQSGNTTLYLVLSEPSVTLKSVSPTGFPTETYR